MSTSSINSLSGILVQNYFSVAVPNSSQNGSIGAIPVGTQTDSSRLSPFAELLSKLQKLQQSDPVRYVEVTQKIADNLHTAAQAADKDGNTKLAKQLEQLYTDFTRASKSRELPNVQDLATALSRSHRGHGHAHIASKPDTAGSSSSGSELNPLDIIFKTLSEAGVGTA